MKKIKRISLSKKFVAPMIIVGVIAIATLNSAGLVDAQQSDSDSDTQQVGPRESLSHKFASRFGLNETDVNNALKEFRMDRNQERHARMEENLSNRLEQAVENGTLTSAQMYSVLEKHAELESKFDELDDLSPEERHEAMADIHDEMDAWAQERGIDMNKIARFERELRRNGSVFMRHFN
ncbi:MAG: hypothetical protein H6772_01710 [Pseudomonadales bacterium]|nr:hypothetical protein [Pseudomonadales bacterium]